MSESATICCYARSDKWWTEDPQGTRWETFHTLGEATTYHGGDAPCATDGTRCSPDVASVDVAPPRRDAACCAPQSNCC